MRLTPTHLCYLCPRTLLCVPNMQTILTGRFAPLAELERKEYGPVGRRLLQDENYQTVPISPATERVLQAQLEAPKPRP